VCDALLGEYAGVTNNWEDDGTADENERSATNDTGPPVRAGPSQYQMSGATSLRAWSRTPAPTPPSC